MILFLLGSFCALTRRNAIGILLGIELILNAANVNYVAFAFFGGSGAKYDGQVFAIFVIMLAAYPIVVTLYSMYRRIVDRTMRAHRASRTSVVSD